MMDGLIWFDWFLLGFGACGCVLCLLHAMTRRRDDA